MRLGDAVDVGKGVALVAKTAGDQLAGAGHHLAREHLARLDQQQLAHFFLGHAQVARQLHLADAVLFALVDVDGDVDVLLVRGDGHLGGGDVHVDVAAIQIVGTQPLQVAGELLAGVLVVVAEERQPVAGAQLEQPGQLLVGEHLVADDVDVLDGRDRTFVDLDLQCHAVARQGLDLGLDAGRIAALGDVLALQLVAHALEGGLLEDLAFGQAGLPETLEQLLGGNRLVAFDLDAGDRRTLDHFDDQHTAITAEADVLEEAGPEQGAGRIHQTAFVDRIADVQRQGAEHAAGGDALQTVDADVGDGEGLGVNLGGDQRGDYRR